MQPRRRLDLQAIELMPRHDPSRALFIPLKGKYFDAFANGTKTTEYRLRGPRWNAETCRIGRRVVLSRGYGKKHRLNGIITGFHHDTLPAKIPGWIECYGMGAGDAACITISILNASVMARPDGGPNT